MSNEELKTIEEIKQLANIIDVSAEELQAGLRNLLSPKCGNEVWLKWDVERDGYTIYCPYCGYRMKLCSMCDVRDGGKCDWNPDNEKCKHDQIENYEGFDRNMSDVEKEENYDRK